MSKTILTVDDSVSVRMMVSFTLKQAGYDVVEAVNGVDALVKLEETSVNMMIVDLNMPQLDGIGLIKKVRGSDAKYSFVPIVILTTESQQAKKEEAKSSGATGWMVKPFRPEQLLAVVKKVLG